MGYFDEARDSIIDMCNLYRPIGVLLQQPINYIIYRLYNDK